MKKVFVVIMLSVGFYYLYSKYFYSIDEKNLPARLQNGETITVGEFLASASEYVDYLCGNDIVQSKNGGNKMQCLERYERFKTMCEERIFPNTNLKIEDIDSFNKYSIRYVNCVLNN